MELLEEIVVGTCGHSTIVTCSPLATDAKRRAKILTASSRACHRCRENANLLLQAQQKADRKQRRIEQHQKKLAKEAESKAQRQQEKLSNHNVSQQSAMDDLETGTIIEMVRLESGAWWGRIRKHDTAFVRVGNRPIGLLFRLAEKMDERYNHRPMENGHE